MLTSTALLIVHMALRGVPVVAQDSLLTMADLEVASVTIGTDTAVVHLRLGTPQGVTVAATERWRHVTWSYEDIELSFLEAGYRSTLRAIRIKSRRLPTHRGLRIGDSRERVVQLYGPPSEDYRCHPTDRPPIQVAYVVPNSQYAPNLPYALNIMFQADTVASIWIHGFLERVCLSIGRSRSSPRLDLAARVQRNADFIVRGRR